MDKHRIAQGERLLAQRSIGWKLGVSSWVVLVGLGFVFFSVIGWVIGSILSRSKKMWVITTVWFVLYMVGVTLDMDQSWALGAFMAIWLGSFGHAAYLSRGVLRSRALSLASPTAHHPDPSPHQQDQPATRPEPTVTGMAPISMPHGVRPQPENLQDSPAPPLPEQRQQP